jgi:hypothetical protein
MSFTGENASVTAEGHPPAMDSLLVALPLVTRSTPVERVRVY